MIKIIYLILLFFNLNQLIECKLKILSLVNRKTYLIPIRTKFILKCSTSKFDDNNLEDDLNRNDQFDDDLPELIVLNNLEQTKKLLNYFNKLNETNSDFNQLNIIGWNRTSLDTFKLNDYSFNRKFNKYYEDMYLGGKSFYQPNDNISLFGVDSSCLIFNSFTKKDESIYSCFYKPKFNSLFSNLFNFNNKKLKDLNLFNNISMIEKLIYITCLLTWPFDQDCYLVKQFKLQIEYDQFNNQPNDYWSNLDAHDQFRFKKLNKKLMKYCHSTSLIKSKLLLNKKISNLDDDKNKSTSNLNEHNSNSINDFFKYLYNNLMINLFYDLIGSLFSILFNELINGLFNNLITNSISDLINDLINELFIEPFKDLDLFYLIYILLFLFIYFSCKSDDRSKISKKRTERLSTKKTEILQIEDKNFNEKKILDEHEISIKKLSLSNIDDQNLKFNTVIFNKNIDTNLNSNILPFNHIKNDLQNDDDDNIKKFKNLFKKSTNIDLINKQKLNKNDDEFKKDQNLLNIKNYKDYFHINKDDQTSNINDEFKLEFLKNNKLINSEDKNLEFKGEIKISKLGEVSYLGKFLFNLPKELEDKLDNKPFQLIFEDTITDEFTNSESKLNNLTNGNKLMNNFSDDLSPEKISNVESIGNL